MTTLTQARLKELLRYDLKTGIFTRRRASPSGRHGVGTVAGSARQADGYVELAFEGHRFYAHRLAWFYSYGVWPSKELDHRNHKTGDNRLCNLRDGARSQNNENQVRPQRTNKSGFLGVSWSKAACKWVAFITTNKKKRYLGLFLTPEAGHRAYLRAKRKLHVFNTL